MISNLDQYINKSLFTSILSDNQHQIKYAIITILCPLSIIICASAITNRKLQL